MVGFRATRWNNYRITIKRCLICGNFVLNAQASSPISTETVTVAIWDAMS